MREVDNSHIEPSPKPTFDIDAFDSLMLDAFWMKRVNAGIKPAPNEGPAKELNETAPKQGILAFAEEFERAKAILIDAVAENQGDGYDPDCD